MTGVTGTFRLFGLVICSEIPLDELAPAPPGRPDVRIVAGVVGPIGGTRGVTGSPEGLVLNLPGLARFTVTDTRILVDTEGDASGRNVRLYLLGSAFGALLHLRGLLPLHANAIDLGGRAVAFLGESGAGKSTIAAWFHARGAQVLADDVCAVETVDGTACAHPGLPRLRLWRDALEHRGRSAKDYSRSFDALDKYDVPMGGEACAGPVPLAAMYRLGRAEAGTTPAIRRLAGVEAVDALVANTYRGGYLPHIDPRNGGVARHLAACVSLARTVPVFAADRIWGYDQLDAEAERLEAHALGLGVELGLEAKLPQAPRYASFIDQRV